MTPIKVFWFEPAPVRLARVSLRRFTYRDKQCRAKTDWGHDASVVIHEREPLHVWIDELPDDTRRVRSDMVSRDDPRWPAECKACGEPFQVDDEWQVNAPELYFGAPDGKLYTLRDAPVGAMYDAHWMGDWARGPDGIALTVVTPGGVWMVDHEASNCTRPQQQPAGDAEHPNATRFVRSHHCWIRHGDPRTGNIHVDKNGDTCAAGGGSIIIGGWHGFLHDSHLVVA